MLLRQHCVLTVSIERGALVGTAAERVIIVLHLGAGFSKYYRFFSFHIGVRTINLDTMCDDAKEKRERRAFNRNICDIILRSCLCPTRRLNSLETIGA